MMPGTKGRSRFCYNGNEFRFVVDVVVASGVVH